MYARCRIIPVVTIIHFEWRATESSPHLVFLLSLSFIRSILVCNINFKVLSKPTTTFSSMARTPKREVNQRFQPWFISSGTKLLGHFDTLQADTTRDEYTCQPSPEQVWFQQVLQASTEPTMEAVYHNGDVGRGAAKLNVMTREAWIDVKPRYITYKHSRGKRTMEELVNPLKFETCAK